MRLNANVKFADNIYLHIYTCETNRSNPLLAIPNHRAIVPRFRYFNVRQKSASVITRARLQRNLGVKLLLREPARERSSLRSGERVCHERLYNRRSRLSGFPNEPEAPRTAVSGPGKVFNELLRSSFPRRRTAVYFGKVKPDDALVPVEDGGNAVHRRSLFVFVPAAYRPEKCTFEMKCASGRATVCLGRAPPGDVN